MDRTDIDAAKEELWAAVDFTGGLQCHECGEGAARKKVQMRRSSVTGRPYVKCHRCGWHSDAINLLTDVAGVSFPDAVNLLLGRHPDAENLRASGDRPVIPERFRARLGEPNMQVYKALCDIDTPGIQSAARTWQREHGIPESIGRLYGVTQVIDPRHLKIHLERRFGMQRLIEAGLTSESGGRFLFEGGYELVEAHTAPSGHVFCVQFRAVGNTARAAREHKRTKGTPEATPYVPSVLAIRGSSPEHLIGCGLRRIAQRPPGTTVHVVEGFKDMLAAAALGLVPYGLPGAATLPPEAVVKLFQRRKNQVVLALDNDPAGLAGADQLERFFADHGIPTTRQFPDEGMDWADMLTAGRTPPQTTPVA